MNILLDIKLDEFVIVLFQFITETKMSSFCIALQISVTLM